jgi:branched-chain amino acid transport system ATP-binding protein
MDALRVEGLWKNFGGIQVLQDVSFTQEAGEYWGLIGPNGAGKTTLINILSGELLPTKGQVHILGQDVTHKPAHQRLRLGLAHSFQLNNLFFNLTVLDNILLALRGKQPFRFQILSSIGKSDQRFRKIRELMETMGLWEKRNFPIASLSYGEQRMMEIALSLASEPRLLLLDEPSAGLSPSEITQVLDLIRNLPQETAVLFVTHDMDVLFDLARRILVLSFGELIAQGTAKEIQANSSVREVYLGGEKRA